MSEHMFNEDGICDCIECCPTNTPTPNREKTMNLEKGKTYRRTDLSEGDWRDAVKATMHVRVEAWWEYGSDGECLGARGTVVGVGYALEVCDRYMLSYSGHPASSLTEFTVLELPAHLDPARALVVRDRDGDLWARTVGDTWHALPGYGSLEDFGAIAAMYGTLTVVIDADGNVVDEGDR